MMDHPEIRREELQTLRKWGIKGVKVDFFQSDKQNIIQLYHDIQKTQPKPRSWSTSMAVPCLAAGHGPIRT